MSEVSFLDSVTSWQILAAIGILLIISEMFVSGFVMLPMGIAFLLTAVCAIFIHNWIVLVVILAGFELAVFLLFKQLNRFQGKTNLYSNAEGMIGKECVVIEAISVDRPGYVKLYGDEWQAHSLDGRSFQKGERVIIAKLDGNKVIVEAIN